MICGVEYSTENFRDDRPVKVFVDRNIDKARAWRNEIGPDGDGPTFSPTNGHRIIRRIYQMPRGWRRLRDLKASKIDGELVV